MTIRQLLIIAAKNAVNASLLTAIQILHDPADNNFHNWHGLKGVAWMIGSAVVAREGLIWLPLLIKWSTTNAEVPKS